MCTASVYMCVCMCSCVHVCMSISSVTQELNVEVTGLELSPAAAQCAVLRLEQLAVNKVSGRRSLQVAIQWVWPSHMYTSLIHA